MKNIAIDGHKLYWHLDRVVQWQNGPVIPPLYVEVSPVGYCNHRCIFCGIDFAMDKKSRLEPDDFRRAAAELAGQGLRSMMFAGEGEPLLHENIVDMIRWSRQCGIDASMTTNGTAGHYGIWADILPSLTWLRFSVDAGSPDVYGAVHGVKPGVFARTVESIAAAVKAKRDRHLPVTVGAQFLIIEENLHDIGNALRLFEELGVDYLSLKPYSLHPKMLRRKDLLYSEETLEAVDRAVKGHRGALNILFRKEAMGKYMEQAIGYRRCLALPFWGYISSKGDFYTCSVFIGDERFRAGNIHTDTVESILYGDRRKASIAYGSDRLDVNEECRVNCRMARVNEFLSFVADRPAHINFI
jgi:radical SAM protein with 4Fe4S-binding SPASM domain